MAFQSAEPTTSPSPFALHGAAYGVMQGSAMGANSRSQRLLPDQIEESLRGAFNRLAGVGLIAFAVAAWASLLTWSIDDPSLSRAGHVPVTNFLGVAGAAVSDLLLRGIGLASAFALLPLVITGQKPGHEIEYPLAVVILGGLVTSTVLNLFLLPALYLRFGGGVHTSVPVQTP